MICDLHQLFKLGLQYCFKDANGAVLFSIFWVQIDYRIITVILIHMIACVKSIKEMKTLRKGERITLMKFKNKNVITAGYRDFLFLFMLGVPDSKMLERALVILKRDYGDLYTGFTASADAGLKKIKVTRSYALYG